MAVFTEAVMGVLAAGAVRQADAPLVQVDDPSEPCQPSDHTAVPGRFEHELEVPLVAQEPRHRGVRIFTAAGAPGM